jgi:four helix bundle protein
MENARMVKSFRDLVVWRKSMRLCLQIYQLTRQFPREETYGLASQMRRAGVSAPSNIAEGFGRRSAADYRAFLAMARGSILEIETQLEIARELKYSDPKLLARASELAEEVSRMLWALSGRIAVRTGRVSPEASGLRP